MKKSSLIIYICLVCLAGTAVNSCKKNSTINPGNPPVTPPVTPPAKAIVAIDSTKLILNTDPALINIGKYEYTVVGAAPSFKVNDVIVGATDGGYIRKITSVSTPPNKIVLETSQGNMEDVFQNQGFGFTTKIDSLLQARPLSGYEFDVSGTTLFQSGPLTIKLDRGTIKVDGDWNFGFKFTDYRLDTFEMSCNNVTFNGQFDLNISATQATTLTERTVVLARIAKYNTFIVGGYPVVLYTEVELRSVFSASIDALVQRNLVVNTSNTASVGIKYKNSQWQNFFNKSTNSTISVPPRSGNVNAQIKMGIVPYISFRLYRVLGPYFSLGLQESINASASVPALNWDFSASAWLQTIIGVRANILGASLFDYNKEWNTDTLSYKTPYTINRISGDNQTGIANQLLAQPIKVRVLDNNNSPQSNAVVSFVVTAGGGSVQNATILTDNNGYAETGWRLGSQPGIQTLTASVKKGDGSFIQNAPIEFAATLQALPTVNTSAVSLITPNTAACGGTVTSDGGSAVTVRGVCWNTSSGPTTANNKTSNGTGTGAFTSTLTGLAASTTYYVRAYATNNVGTAYGNEFSFTTGAATLATISTTSISSITSTTAQSGGNITSDGGSPITARGVCWYYTSNPTISNFKTSNGTGTGVFNSSITGLAAATTYYVRAYATNSAGTAYGDQYSFTTINPEWATTNLSVTTYRNGDPIPEVTDATQWNNTTTGAWCYYDNNPANAIYGKIYNGYAVNDPRGLAPVGWHIPSSQEWELLATTLGGRPVAGGAMKTTGTIIDGTGLWFHPNTGATNSSGFSALPGGIRQISGPTSVFSGLGYYGFWWSANHGTSYNDLVGLAYNDVGMGVSALPSGSGMSVRLVKD